MLFVLFFSIPQPTHAQYTDIVHTPIGAYHAIHGTITSITTGVTAGTTGTTALISSHNWVVQHILDPLAIAIAKTVIKQITAQTVRWINSGFRGNPAYVTNPEQFFLNVGDQTASQFILGAGLTGLCSPFSAQVRLALAKSYLTQPTYSCTLGAIANNFDNFTNNFSSGGWTGWFSMTQNDSNNPYGAQIVGIDRLEAQIGSKTTHYQDQLSQGKGFLSWETCADGSGSGAAAQGDKRTVCLNPASPVVTSVCITSDVQVYQNGKWVSQGSLGPVDVSTNSALVDCGGAQTQTNTPGSIIEGQLEGQLGTGIRQLELTNSINQVVSALMTEMIGQVVGGIGSGLRGLSQSSSAQPVSLLDQLISSSTQNTENKTLLQGIQAGIPAEFNVDVSATKTNPSSITPIYTPPTYDQIRPDEKAKSAQESTDLPTGAKVPQLTPGTTITIPPDDPNQTTQ